MSQRLQWNTLLTEQSLAAILVVVALMGSHAIAADPLQPATSSRGTVKVRARYFNPFAVQRSRLQMDPFGFFTLLPGNTASSAEAPAVLKVSGTATASPAASTTTSSTEAANGTDDASTITTSVRPVTPSFRPDPRSPFRPPTRPPFM